MSDESADTGFVVELPVFAGPFRVLADLLLDQKRSCATSSSRP